MAIVRTTKKKLPAFNVTTRSQKQQIKGVKTKDGNIEYVVHGSQHIHITW